MNFSLSKDTLFSEFLQQFGPAIFPLSRLILLGKRILLYSCPPIGSLCNAGRHFTLSIIKIAKIFV